MIYPNHFMSEFCEQSNSSFSNELAKNYFENYDPTERMQFFDKEGFELTDLEVTYSKVNFHSLTNRAFGHRVIGWKWYEDGDFKHPNIFVDHSFISWRYGFTNDAREQLLKYKDKYPILNKLLQIRPKIGIDVALEIRDGDFITELVHIERDYHNWQDAWNGLKEVQSHLGGLLWDRAIEQVRTIQPLISHMPSDDQSDLKARLMGFDRTYKTLKTV